MSSRPYQQGDHVCSIYETAEDQLATAVAYVADGLRRRERCLYVADELDTFRRWLGAAGIDVESAERRTALLLRTKDQAHLDGGHFDYERMLAMLNQAVEDALNAGFAGLRTCGDMTWLLDEAPGSQQVVEYEAQLSQFFATVRALGLCQ